jgi:thiol-disulfide isomerase/thioredoxin
MSLAAFLSVPPSAPGQEVTKQSEPPATKGQGSSALDESIKSIDDEYNQEMLRLDRRRLERLARLAARQNPADAAVTYEQLFRLAIAGNLFRDAEPAAKTLLSTGSPSRIATGLAHVVKIIAECDRGAFDDSLQSLRDAVKEKAKVAQKGAAASELPTAEILEICEAYYQRLIHAGQYATARKAMQTILAQTERPVVKEFVSSRLRRLEYVGKPAPQIRGTDIDGKPFDLAAVKGKVVLVVFWASWYVPAAEEIEALQEVEESYRAKGLQIVGIDLDAVPEGGQKPESSLANVRRFLLDYNVTWPTLINGQGDADYAKAYGVTEIPANVLIARDGTIAQIDLVHTNLDPAIAQAVGK